MEDLLTVDVKVGRALREFVISTKGNDILVPEKNSLLWGILKQHLVVSATGYTPIPEEEEKEYIRVAVRYTHSAVTYSVPSRKKIQVNTLFRTFLSSKGECIIRRHLSRELRKSFRDYMRGCLNNNPDIQIVEAIRRFCTESNIEPDNIITIEALRKDWYRYISFPQDKKQCIIEI